MEIDMAVKKITLNVQRSLNKNWQVNGLTHRDFLPAVILTDGTLGWWENDFLVRTN